MKNNLPKCNSATVCWKDICVTATGVLATVLIVGAAAYGVSKLVKALK